MAPIPVWVVVCVVIGIVPSHPAHHTTPAPCPVTSLPR